jgi:hypothetical protein
MEWREQVCVGDAIEVVFEGDEPGAPLGCVAQEAREISLGSELAKQVEGTDKCLPVQSRRKLLRNVRVRPCHVGDLPAPRTPFCVWSEPRRSLA